MKNPLTLLALGLLCLAGALAAPAPRAAAAAPASFYGVVDQRAFIPADEIARMRRGRVGTVRLLVPWGEIEPTRGEYSWRSLDRRLRALRRTRAEVTPMVYGAPHWLGAVALPAGEPRAVSAWREFLVELVRRYGPDGTLSRTAPRHRALDRWQVWNEPNLVAFWGGLEPSPAGYVDLLRESAAAIHGVDPGARIIAAGLSPANRGVEPGAFLQGMYEHYRRLGAEPDFDQLALHPYARRISDVRAQVRRAISIARAATGSAPPLIVAEVGWGSDRNVFHPLAGTPRDQGRRLRGVYRMFERKRRRWRVRSVLWYSWRDLPSEAPACTFCTMTGLLDARGRPKKPAWRSFKRLTAS